MKDTLIIKFETKGFEAPFSFLIEVENTLINAFSQNNHAIVDRHDFGSEDMNIFYTSKRSLGASY
jgi:hypothetical protein